MVSLIINDEGWMSLADKDSDVRWGNVDGFGRYNEGGEAGILTAYRKMFDNKTSFEPDFEEYLDLAYHCLLQWPVESLGEPPEGHL